MRERKKHIACGSHTEIVQGIRSASDGLETCSEKQIESKVENKGSLHQQNEKMQVDRWSGGAGDSQIRDWGKLVQGSLYKQTAPQTGIQSRKLNIATWKEKKTQEIDQEEAELGQNGGMIEKVSDLWKTT